MPSRSSAQTKRLRGTLRDDRKPKLDVAARLRTAPPAPKHLSPRAKEEWRRVAPAVIGLGTLTTADLRAFELLAQTLATATEATELLAVSGLSCATADGGLKPHPCVRILETARTQAKALLADFGLTPRGRQSIDIHPFGDGTPNPFAKLGRFDEFLR